MITLTVAEILDLARFAGIALQLPNNQPKDDELETEITVAACPPDGVWDEDGIDVRHYAHVAYFTEYPEEGGEPLGEEIEKGTTK